MMLFITIIIITLAMIIDAYDEAIKSAAIWLSCC